MTQNTVTFALAFPQGHILFLQNGGSYFLPAYSMDAFQVWAERKELFGKNALTVKGDKATADYSIVYEFTAAGVLSDARLVTKDQTINGTLADTDFINSVNGALAQSALKLYTTRDTQPDTVFNAARFGDGRLLIQLMNRNELYLGTPGAYTKLDAKLYTQGGNSMYYRDADGGQINLPYGLGGPRAGEPPTYKGEMLAYVAVDRSADPAQFGLDVFTGIKHLTPFSPELNGTAPITPRPPQV